MTIQTETSQIIKLTEEPRWNEFHKVWYAAGYRFIKSRKTFSTVCLLHNFKSFTAIEA